MNFIEFLRQFRIGGFAVFDFAVSFLGIYLLSSPLSKLFLKIRIEIPKKNWLFLILPISIVVHFLFGTMTPMARNFLNLQDYYLLKIIILGLLYLGFRNIKITKTR